MTEGPHPLQIEFAALSREAGPQERVAAVYRAYNTDTGATLGPDTAGPDDTAAVRLWLSGAEMSQQAALTWYKKPFLQPWVHGSVAAKANWLRQAPCPTCHPLPDSDGGPPHMYFHVRVPPFSKQVQATSVMWTATGRSLLAEREHLGARREQWRGVGICASVVGIQRDTARIIDVDNMAKAVLDILKGIVFPDDRQIQHLSVNRVRHPDESAFYLIGLRAVRPDLADVIDPACQVRFV
ncbi:RusA family crossover junction endodeoxyribonuclease [Phytohabitans rumicis]|uniref:Uncharacterized protein n=1 Tax=Phytohabitans rumicis TaxID=1076125 RepID=A0A6V8L7B0_9ACTN|nr:RusA family crossover junction endodeoxyribonuclease [Phytohabitans rumicis]GFJ93142.1 hypothetical protein Prum_067840 [Phytohabitans rumicis]